MHGFIVGKFYCIILSKENRFAGKSVYHALRFILRGVGCILL